MFDLPYSCRPMAKNNSMIEENIDDLEHWDVILKGQNLTYT